MARISVRLELAEPVSFTLGERTFRVSGVIDRWHGADHAYYKVMADDGNLYILRHDQEEDAWEMVMMEAAPGKRP